MEDALTELRKFEAELKVKSSHLKNLRVDISNPTASLSQLKGMLPVITTFVVVQSWCVYDTLTLSLSDFIR